MSRNATQNDAAEGFLLMWKRLANSDVVWTPEYKFCHAREWRFDAAHVPSLVAVEIEGVVFRGKSRHTTVKGYSRDCEKYNAAAALGWSVLRYTQLDLQRMPLQMIEQIKAVIATHTAAIDAARWLFGMVKQHVPQEQISRTEELVVSRYPWLQERS